MREPDRDSIFSRFFVVFFGSLGSQISDLQKAGKLWLKVKGLTHLIDGRNLGSGCFKVSIWKDLGINGILVDLVFDFDPVFDLGFGLLLAVNCDGIISLLNAHSKERGILLDCLRSQTFLLITEIDRNRFLETRSAKREMCRFLCGDKRWWSHMVYDWGLGHVYVDLWWFGLNRPRSVSIPSTICWGKQFIMVDLWFYWYHTVYFLVIDFNVTLLIFSLLEEGCFILHQQRQQTPESWDLIKDFGVSSKIMGFLQIGRRRLDANNGESLSYLRNGVPSSDIYADASVDTNGLAEEGETRAESVSAHGGSLNGVSEALVENAEDHVFEQVDPDACFGMGNEEMSLADLWLLAYEALEYGKTFFQILIHSDKGPKLQLRFVAERTSENSRYFIISFFGLCVEISRSPLVPGFKLYKDSGQIELWVDLVSIRDPILINWSRFIFHDFGFGGYVVFQFWVLTVERLIREGSKSRIRPASKTGSNQGDDDTLPPNQGPDKGGPGAQSLQNQLVNL